MFTTTGFQSPKRGFKIFYSTARSHFPELQETRGEVEPITIPSKVMHSLVSHLEKSTELLPENARNFGKWNVGILDTL